MLLRRTRPPAWRLAGIGLGVLAVIAGAVDASQRGVETVNTAAMVVGVAVALYALFGREFWIEP
ncbi:MAG TPA: hypothetical protein VM889_09145 [Candidatus Thermoplasmatota archaeon]|nr:hypothetical protein [Candidatus Thermoplasmatota archaeon]